MDYLLASVTEYNVCKFYRLNRLRYYQNKIETINIVKTLIVEKSNDLVHQPLDALKKYMNNSLM